MTGNSGKRMLPANPHLGHLRRQAKAQLEILRTQDSTAQLADAQFALARDYGFTSWRALIGEAMQRRTAFLQTHPDARCRAPSLQRFWLARRHDLNPDPEPQAGFLRAAAVMHIGFIFVALTGVSLLFLDKEHTGTAHAPPGEQRSLQHGTTPR